MGMELIESIPQWKEASVRKLRKLKLFRTILGISQWDLAEQTKIRNYRLSLIENGRVEPKAEELEALAKALGTTVELLVDEDETESLESLVRSQQVA